MLMKTVKYFLSLLLLVALSAPSFGMSAQAHRGTILQALEILQKGDEKEGDQI